MALSGEGVIHFLKYEGVGRETYGSSHFILSSPLFTVAACTEERKDNPVEELYKSLPPPPTRRLLSLASWTFSSSSVAERRKLQLVGKIHPIPLSAVPSHTINSLFLQVSSSQLPTRTSRRRLSEIGHSSG
jgi:hypothetical protein